MSISILGRRWLIPAMLTASVCAFSGCDNASDGPVAPLTRNVSHRLSVLQTCDDLTEAVVDAVEDQIVQSLSYDYGRPDYDTGGQMPSPPSADGEAGGEETPEYTDTNLQEAGVDEADIFKTNGTHIFTVQGSKLRIFKSFPTENTEQIAEVELPRAYNQEMFLIGQTLVVTSHSWGFQDSWAERCRLWKNGCDTSGGGIGTGGPKPGAEPDIDPGMPGMPPDEGHVPTDGFYGTRVIAFDITDPAAPIQTREWKITGNVITTRVVDGLVYLVQQKSSDALYTGAHTIMQSLNLDKKLGKYRGEERAARAHAMRPQIRAAIYAQINADAIAGLIVPSVSLNDGEKTLALSCNQLLRPDAMSQTLSSISVLAIDPTKDALPTGSAILADGWNVYGSLNAMYIARSSDNWAWGFQPSVVYTDIHQFDLNDGKPAYVASGSVDGTVNGRFAMSERDGHFRIATTDVAPWNNWGGGGPVFSDDTATSPDGPSVGDAGTQGQAQTAIQANNLYVLKRDGTELGRVGSIHGFGKNEQIYGIRYVDDMAYVVTFRRTDPLYAIDLSVPTAPTIRGELKIPGFSNFLQSISDGWLVGIGNDADDDGRVTGFQISLFDVQNADAPTRADNFVIPFGSGYAQSEAAYESRAFTWSKLHTMLAIPMSIYDYSNNSTSNFLGAVVFKITPADGIEEVGRVNHDGMARTIYCETENCYAYDEGYWGVQMRRTAFIGSYFIAMSNVGITVSPVGTISAPILSIPFE